MEFEPILLLRTAEGLVACCFPADEHEQLSQGRPKRAQYRTNPATWRASPFCLYGESRRRYDESERRASLWRRVSSGFFVGTTDVKPPAWIRFLTVFTETGRALGPLAA